MSVEPCRRMELKQGADIAEGCPQPAPVSRVDKRQDPARYTCSQQNVNNMVQSDYCAESSHKFEVACSHRPHRVEQKDNAARKQATAYCSQNSMPPEVITAQQHTSSYGWIRKPVRDTVLLHVYHSARNRYCRCVEKQNYIQVHDVIRRIRSGEGKLRVETGCRKIRYMAARRLYASTRVIDNPPTG